MKALNLYGKNWKEVERFIGTRSASQARSHAQKYFGRYFELVTRGDVYSTCSPAVQYMSSSKIYGGNLGKGKPAVVTSVKELQDMAKSSATSKSRTIQCIPSGMEAYRMGAIEQIQVQSFPLETVQEVHKEAESDNLKPKAPLANTSSQKEGVH